MLKALADITQMAFPFVAKNEIFILHFLKIIPKAARLYGIVHFEADRKDKSHESHANTGDPMFVCYSFYSKHKFILKSNLRFLAHMHNVVLVIK